jgi:hypothetical protein
MAAHIDQNASENATEIIQQHVEDFEEFDAFDLLNVCAYAVMSVSKYFLLFVLIMFVYCIQKKRLVIT